jgi:hypothetical protein
MNSMHLRRLAERSHWKARAAARKSQQAAIPSSWLPCSNRAQPGPCVRTFWFLVGGVAVICWTEKIGTKKHVSTHILNNWRGIKSPCSQVGRRSFKDYTTRKWYVSTAVICRDLRLISLVQEHRQHLSTACGTQWASMHSHRGKEKPRDT